MKRLSLLTLATLAVLAGCDGARQDTGSERADGLYRSAMADYSAGRLDKAVEGLQKVLKASPGNTSARFQLACLLQDVRKDYLGAICNYREFLLLADDADKAKLARSRLERCEALYAPELAKRMKISDGTALSEENERYRAERESMTKQLNDLKARLERAESRCETYAKENERLRKMMGGAGSPEAPSQPQKISEQSLLDEDEEVDRVKFSADVKNLLIEGESESRATPFQTAPAPAPAQAAPAAPQEPPHEERPATYVVAEGDTLHRLAIRFYGRRSAWKLIRDANRTQISTDGRIRAGMTIKLP